LTPQASETDPSFSESTGNLGNSSFKVTHGEWKTLQTKAIKLDILISLLHTSASVLSYVLNYTAYEDAVTCPDDAD